MKCPLVSGVMGLCWRTILGVVSVLIIFKVWDQMKSPREWVQIDNMYKD